MLAISQAPIAESSSQATLPFVYMMEKPAAQVIEKTMGHRSRAETCSALRYTVVPICVRSRMKKREEERPTTAIIL